RPGGAIEFMDRASTGAGTAFIAGGTQSLPAWLQLSRSGSTIIGSVSADGSNWTTIGTTTVSMATSIDAGLAVTSHDTTATNTSTFDNVTVSGPPPPAPPTGSTPFTGTPATIPGTLHAENYDNGGEGVAYYDTTPGNSGGQYRSDDVDIENS